MTTTSNPLRPGISPETLADAGVCCVTPEEGMRLVGQSVSGLWIPYPGVAIDGRPYGRIRLSTPTHGQKYTQAEGSGAHAFIPAAFKHLESQPDLVIVEGEFKALSLCEAGFRAIGIGGVTSALTRSGDPGAPRHLLFEIADHLERRPARRILFLGDTDTAFSAAFAHEAVALARAAQPASEWLPRIPITLPKGIDDVRESMGNSPAFGAWWAQVVASAIEVGPKTDGQALAVELARRELAAIKDHPRRLEWESLLYRLAIDLTGAALDGLAAAVHEVLGIRPGAFEKTVRAKRKAQAEERGIDLRAKAAAGDVHGDVDARLTERWGEPYYGRASDGGFVVQALNERWWAARWLHGRDALFDPADQTFWVYDGETGLWRPRTQASICAEIGDLLLQESRGRDLPRIAELNTLDRRRKICQTLEEMIERSGTWERRGDRIHVANGMIEIDTQTGAMSLRPWRADDYSRNRLPLPWDPQAPIECPRFLGELVGPAMAADDVDLLQRVAGISLLPRNLPQKILILEGTGGAGKTTLARVLQGLVGGHNCAELRTRQLEERFELYRFRNSTLLYGPDVPGDFLNEAGAQVLKSLVGGDLLSAEGKGLSQDCQLLGVYHVHITCNSRLTVRLQGDTEAWQRRLLIIKYENGYKPAKKIDQFDRWLLEHEGAGILAWALEGLRLYFVDRAKVGGDDYILTSRQKKVVTDLLAESESIRWFVESRLERHQGSDVSSNELLEAYGAYCSDMGWNAASTTVFEKRVGDAVLRAHGASKSNSVKREGRQVRGFRSIRLIEVVDAEEPVNETETQEEMPMENSECETELATKVQFGTGGTGKNELLRVRAPGCAHACTHAHEDTDIHPSHPSRPALERPEVANPVDPETFDRFRAFLGQVFPVVDGARMLGKPIDELWLAASGFTVPKLWHVNDSGSQELMTFAAMVETFLARPIYIEGDNVVESSEDGIVFHAA